MLTVFADAFYWIALIDRNDSFHSDAWAWAKKLEKTHIITSEFVFIEVLNGFSKNVYMKMLACRMIERMIANSMTTVVPSTHLLFRSAIKKYKQVVDKEWSLVDCSSFQIMQDKQITQALTYDKHFEQAGFVALFRN